MNCEFLLINGTVIGVGWVELLATVLEFVTDVVEVVDELAGKMIM